MDTGLRPSSRPPSERGLATDRATSPSVTVGRSSDSSACACFHPLLLAAASHPQKKAVLVDSFRSDSPLRGSSGLSPDSLLLRLPDGPARSAAKEKPCPGRAQLGLKMRSARGRRNKRTNSTGEHIGLNR